MRKKIMFYITISNVIALFLITLLFVSISDYQYEQDAIKNLRRHNNTIINFIKSDNLQYNLNFLKNNYKDSDIRITLIDKKGKVIYDSKMQPSSLKNHNNRKEIIEARKKGNGFDKRVSSSIGNKRLYYATTFKNGYIIRSSINMNLIKTFMNDYLKYYLMVVFFVLLISLVISYKLSYVVIEPLNNLSSATSKISKGEFGIRIRNNSNDEIGKLGESFNKMADKLEMSLKDSREKQTSLEAILKSMDSGIIAIDKNFKVIMINPYAENLFGINKNVVGENLLDCIRNYELEQIFKKNKKDYNEIKINWPEEKILRIKITDIVNKDEHIGRVAVIQDVTDIRNLENMRSQFVANVSHELKTPLTSIKGFAETLKDVDDAEIREKFLNIINDETERLTRLISDILTLSNIEQEKEFTLEKVNVNEEIQNIFNIMKNSADNKKIKLIIVDDEVPDILANKDMFKQMLINLVDNAIKYSRDGDKVIIGAKKEKDMCILWVEDTGVGISKDHIPRLFERFYRVDKARSRIKGGTGLGLAIVKHIVISFKGNISVESELNKGTKFTVKIPYV